METSGVQPSLSCECDCVTFDLPPTLPPMAPLSLVSFLIGMVILTYQCKHRETQTKQGFQSQPSVEKGSSFKCYGES